MTETPDRTAVVLFNLGGPDSPQAIQPFLFNLFNDPAIIGLPRPVRWLAAKLIARRRLPVAREIYDSMGGGSPLLPMTLEQAADLEKMLKADGDYRVFVAMRYWHPRAAETVAAVKAYAPDRIVLLPLYPQFSTTTTGSSLAEWRQAAAAAGLGVPSRALCCYPLNDGWIAAQARLISDRLASLAEPYRVLFSAHGLPKKIVAKGDPYQWQVERTAATVAATAGLAKDGWQVCYQSRVGPLEWIGPSLDEALETAARDRVGVVVTPIAFVSEHSETLVELDREYAKKAAALGVPGYHRVPTVSTRPEFIAGLAGLVRTAAGMGTATVDGRRLCPGDFNCCSCYELEGATP